MKLLFSNSYGIERVIGEPNCLSEATRIISDFLEEHNMKLFVNVDDGTVIVYDNYGNDIEHMTLSQLSKRVQIS